MADLIKAALEGDFSTVQSLILEGANNVKVKDEVRKLF